MSDIRKVKRVMQSRPTLEGAGVHLKRVFGFNEVPLLDPFLLLDDFRSTRPADYKPGFPWHPHRGIETITYVLAGEVEHADSLGNRGVISPGDVQWMTAGSGIIHQEMPRGDKDGQMFGFQLWANLPAAQKMMDPRYREVKRSAVPEAVLENGVKLKVIAGEAGGQHGPVRDIVIDPLFIDVTVPPGTTFNHPVQSGYKVFAYVIEGKGYFCPEKKDFSSDVRGNRYFELKPTPFVENEMLVLYAEGDEIAVATVEDSVRFLLVAGKPLEEPVAWYGPVVMNTREELETAFEEYRNGTFIRSHRDQS